MQIHEIINKPYKDNYISSSLFTLKRERYSHSLQKFKLINLHLILLLHSVSSDHRFYICFVIEHFCLSSHFSELSKLLDNLSGEIKWMFPLMGAGFIDKLPKQQMPQAPGMLFPKQDLGDVWGCSGRRGEFPLHLQQSCLSQKVLHEIPPKVFCTNIQNILEEISVFHDLSAVVILFLK